MGVPTAQVQEPQTTQPYQPTGKGAAISMATSDSMRRSDGLDQNAINADPEGFRRWQQNRDAFNSTQSFDMGSDNGGIGAHVMSTQPIYRKPADNPAPVGKGGASTNSATSGQPRMGQPNNYANTVGGWDNASIQPRRSGGKGKGY